MKKALFFAILIIIVPVFSSCSILPPQNRVTAAKLTEREKQLLSIVSDNSYVYDFIVSDDYKSVKLTLEEYRKGELTSEQSMPDTIQKNGTMIFIMCKSEASPSNEKRPYYMSIGSEKGNVSISGTLTGPAEVEVIGRASTVAKDGETMAIPESGALVLASIIYSDNGSISLLPEGSYTDREKTGEFLKEYPLAYILRCEFSKEMPK